MRILIADDDKDIREFLKVNLQAESFAVDTTGDGAEASYMSRTNEYDLIILDNVMPKKCGKEVCSDIRKAGKDTPVIILSVQSEIRDKTELLDIGADDYISKPFSYKELHSRIRAILRRPKKIVSSVIKIDDLVLDSDQQRITRGNKEIYLTRKEFALAEYLMRNRGSVISRGVLMEHVWNDSIDPLSNTVETHIVNLRKKIDRPPKNKIIHTIPGRGYKIESKGKALFS